LWAFAGQIKSFHGLHFARGPYVVHAWSKSSFNRGVYFCVPVKMPNLFSFHENIQDSRFTIFFVFWNSRRSPVSTSSGASVVEWSPECSSAAQQLLSTSKYPLTQGSMYRSLALYKYFRVLKSTCHLLQFYHSNKNKKNSLKLTQ
jgi:hypothetical protein